MVKIRQFIMVTNGGVINNKIFHKACSMSYKGVSTQVSLLVTVLDLDPR